MGAATLSAVPEIRRMDLRLRAALRRYRGELSVLRARSKESGTRNALVARSRHVLELDEVTSARIGAVEARVSELESIAARSTTLAEQLAKLQHNASVMAEQLANLDDHSSSRDKAITALSTTVTSTASINKHQLAGIERSAEAAVLHARIGPVTSWVEAAELDGSVRISVILATRNREALLRRAVASLSSQVNANWELVVVDDGSTDATPVYLSELASQDDRVVVLMRSHGGVGAARNAGLEAATGDVICYLDDDNIMQPLWLKAVAWAFEREMELDLLYGARVTENIPDRDAGQRGLPTLHFEPYDRLRLEAGNFIDLGVLAHRRGLPGARFDASLKALGDWDLVLRLSMAQAPTALPVVAVLYSTTSPNRISEAGHHAEADAQVRSRIVRVHPLRVLAYNSLFPLVSETYIADEMAALTVNGVELAWCTDQWSPSPVSVMEPLYLDLATAVREFDPDVLFVFWAGFCAERLDVIEEIGKPFALRVHSFDYDLAVIERVRTHPLCVGIWAYPHHATRVEGAHSLVPLVPPARALTKRLEPPPARPIVLSASAALQKKDWPTLIAAFAKLARKGVDCRIVVGITAETEAAPLEIRELVAESGAPIMLSVDVPHDQVIDLLSRTAAVVYTKTGNLPFGMPRSIIDGMCAGTSVILPDQPEASLVAGPNCRTYGDSDDIVDQVVDILAGGPEIEAERAFNREFARAHYANASLGTIFAGELTAAVERWKSG
jgi:glycosyltransferase involved in cell wall biosynthesis